MKPIVCLVGFFQAYGHFMDEILGALCKLRLTNLCAY